MGRTSLPDTRKGAANRPHQVFVKKGKRPLLERFLFEYIDAQASKCGEGNATILKHCIEREAAHPIATS